MPKLQLNQYTLSQIEKAFEQRSGLLKRFDPERIKVEYKPWLEIQNEKLLDLSQLELLMGAKYQQAWLTELHKSSPLSIFGTMQPNDDSQVTPFQPYVSMGSNLTLGMQSKLMLQPLKTLPTPLTCIF